ncbi:hypothetical protein JQ554_27725 [Bradyrhizobium diazoefficiens]|nr:hypothetical protein [Bradyrhizobium diazoefficiens]UCF53270.1 MAG: hypothetical protein JSV48_01830 [Bradyrhizobium sp.]MBR0981425.1 hypothetical protein [Bradyrhizobium diazoefficiens]MBR1010879.1 hypothetical protein [Bradyrhizobium diazoefficiens]MBR1015799.1 hypothetical protein [Bradyrhizobium diazoefficiens]
MSNAITATGEKPLTPAMLRELSLRSDRQGLLRAASHYGVIVGVGALIWWVASRYGLLWALPLVVVQGYFVASCSWWSTRPPTRRRLAAARLISSACTASRPFFAALER